jgi:hypothetical protein
VRECRRAIKATIEGELTMTTLRPAPLLLVALAALAFGQRRDVPPAEVWSGKELNAWLMRLEGRKGPAAVEPEPPLPRKVLEALNVTRAGAKGGVMVLRRPEKVVWPEALSEEGHKRWLLVVTRAVQEARRGKPSDAALRDLTATLKGLLADLEKQITDIPPVQYIQAKRMLNLTRDAADLLKREDISELLKDADDLATRRRSVPELVKRMREQKLQFGPALPGHEAEYTALDRAMLEFDARAGK